MLEIVVLLAIIVTTVFLVGITAAFGSENQHSGRKEYYEGSISSHIVKKESK
jgi:hypothetical protein